MKLSYKFINFITYTLLFFALSGCEKGGCYYKCCDENKNCTVGCDDNIKTAEECAVFAKQSCSRRSKGMETGRIEWSAISDIYCSSCSSVACSPEWWSLEKYKNNLEDIKDSLDTSSYNQNSGI
jgi:hypothetical protein